MTTQNNEEKPVINRELAKTPASQMTYREWLTGMIVCGLAARSGDSLNSDTAYYVTALADSIIYELQEDENETQTN